MGSYKIAGARGISGLRHARRPHLRQPAGRLAGWVRGVAVPFRPLRQNVFFLPETCQQSVFTGLRTHVIECARLTSFKQIYQICDLSAFSHHQLVVMHGVQHVARWLGKMKLLVYASPTGKNTHRNCRQDTEQNTPFIGRISGQIGVRVDSFIYCGHSY